MALREESSSGHSAAQQDLVAKRREYILPPPAWARSIIQRLINDPRDEVVAYLFLNIVTLAVPAATALFFLPQSHILGAGYLALNYSMFITRFLVALLHVTDHRRLFKPECGFLNTIVVHLIAPFYGVPSGLYSLHHRVMHHSEGNDAAHDLSSTESYQRDNFLHFIVYWIRHAVGAWVELLVYALCRRRFLLFGMCLLTETSYFAAVYLLWQWKPVATLWTLVIPYLLSSLALMFGNWSQHIFINPDCPSSAYGMAYNCVACPDNAITFNDGYHIQHHLNSKAHWSELPQRFLDTLEEHALQQALIFEGIGVFEVGLAVFMGRFDYLVEHMVDCGEPFASMDRKALVEMFKSRLHPVRRGHDRKHSSKDCQVPTLVYL